MRKAKGIAPLLGFGLMPFSLLFFIFSLSSGSSLIDAPLSITLLLIANVLLLLNDASKNAVFLAFQATFFLFLIAGPLLDAVDKIDFFRNYTEGVVSKTYICYWLAAFAMWCCCLYRSISGKERVFGFGKRKAKSEMPTQQYDLGKIRYFSKLLYYIAILAYFATTADKILFRQAYSLQAYYASYDASSNLPGVIVKISDCHLIALSMFLATKPTKKEARIPLLLFVVVSALTILYGVRHIIMLNLLFVVIYFVLRNDNNEIWLHKKTIVLGVVLSPIVMMVLQAFDVFRRNIAFNLLDIKDLLSLSLIRDFFVSQSVSSYILPNAISHMYLLGDQPVPYTFGTLYTYLTQNMITRLFTGAAAFNSNSFESAMSSANLGSRLAYYMYRESYLAGTGMGGNFVADLFVDFSFPGVFIGTLFACIFISSLSKAVRVKNGSPYMLAFSLVAIRWIIYMPRDSYFAWAMQAFSFMNILFVLAIMLISRAKNDLSV